MARKQIEKDETFSKEAIINSKTFKLNKDALNVLLNDEKRYSISEVKKILSDFMKGKVK